MGEGRVVIMHLLQPMVVSLLPMVPKINHNQAMVLVQGQPMMQLLRLMHLLPTAFLLAMGGNLLHMAFNLLHMAHNLLHMAHNLLHMAHNLVLSSNLSSSLLLYLRLDQLDQCNLCKPRSSSTRLVSLNVDTS